MRRHAWMMFALAVVTATALAACARPVPEPAPAPSAPAAEMRLRSSAFEDGGEIPQRFGSGRVGGRGSVSIPYEWFDVPGGTESLVLTVVDQTPPGKGFVHWLVVDIPAEATELRMGASGREMPGQARELFNSAGRNGYTSPAPPRGTGAHRYKATLYALDIPKIDVSSDGGLEDVSRAMDGHVLGKASYTGTFEP